MAKIYNNFGKIADAIKPACSKVVRKTALDIQANAQANIRANGQVDTGFMVNGVYTVTSTESTYQGGAKALPEVPRPSDELTAYAASAAEYSAYQNYGTRYIAGRPFWEPAVESAHQGFDGAMSAIKDAMEGAAG